VRLSGVTVLCLDNERTILEGMESLLAGWGCRVLKASDLATAVNVITQAQVRPDGVLVDYHLDHGDGIEAIRQLRSRFGTDLAAILITADRTRHMREDARANDIQVLNKPLKPAALRALLTQWRVQRAAAAE
jgi:CheY-like chemotaxis protein